MKEVYYTIFGKNKVQFDRLCNEAHKLGHKPAFPFVYERINKKTINFYQQWQGEDLSSKHLISTRDLQVKHLNIAPNTKRILITANVRTLEDIISKKITEMPKMLGPRQMAIIESLINSLGFNFKEQ